MKEQVFAPTKTDADGNEHQWRGHVRPVRNGEVYGKWQTKVNRGGETISSTIIQSEGYARRKATQQGPADGLMQAKNRRTFLGIPL